MSELSDCPTCSRPTPEEHDYECATCGLMASEHISVTSMCKVLRAVSNRESSLLVEKDRLQRELAEAREQRDRLAEACKLLMRVIGDPNASAEDWWATEDEINAAWNSGSEALAAVKGGPQ